MSEFWSQERSHQLATYVENGLTFHQIAAHMSITRSSVAGRARRMGIKRPPGRPKEETPPPEPKPEKPKRVAPVLEMNPTPLIDATPFQCRYILEGYDEQTPHICGAVGRPWCSFHRKAIFMPVSKKKVAA